MTPEGYQEIGRLYRAALELEAAQRAAYLAEACAGDEALRAEVEALLGYGAQGGRLLDRPALELAARVLVEKRVRSLAGQRVGHCQLLSLLGKGGMGEVWLAEDTRLGRRVAVKLLPAAFTHDAERVRRFAQEARAASSLNHPNIITIFEIGQDQGAHYIVTEFIDGQTLRQRMKGERVGLSAALEVATQVASALQAAHAAGLIHRDIKPENVMLRTDGYVKVLDFGLAKLTESPPPPPDTEAPTASAVTTEAGVVMGTPRYMSPEQARGLKVDARTDIFSLGVVLYEMVAGGAPFEGATVSDLIAAILTQTPPPLSRVAPATPAEFERIVSHALEKDREERYQAMTEMRLDLKRLNRRLEFEAEEAHAHRPAVSGGESGGRGGGIGGEGKKPAAMSTGEVVALKTASSLASLLSGIKRHKLLVALMLVTLLSAVAAAVYLSPFGRSGQAIESLAVLPFVNVGANPETEYLSDGITDSLINGLSQLPKLKVMSRNSVFRYKGKETDAQQVGNALGVRVVLTGKVTQRGNDLAVSAELVDVRDNSHLWGERYNYKLSDLLAAQAELARDISETLRLRLSHEDQQRLTKRGTKNAEAYQLYLKGLYVWNKHTRADLQKGIEYFKQALEKDQNYALAYFGLAASYSVLGNNYVPPHEAFPTAKAYAAKALAIDDTLSEAHMAAGAVKLFYDWDRAEAEKEFKRAQTLDLNNAGAHQLYGDCLEIMGRFDEAKAERQRALELDPLSLKQNTIAGVTYYFAGQYDNAIAQLEMTIDLEPHYDAIYRWLGLAYEQKKMDRKAIETYQKGMTQAGRQPQLMAMLGHAYALAGERGKAQEALAELHEMSKRVYFSPYFFAIVYVGLGDKEQALAWLEKTYQDRSSDLIWLKVEPLFDALRSEPRFQDLLRRVGLQA